MILAQLLLTQVIRDERCQARAEFDEDHAADIAEYLEAGGSVPPVIVYRGSTGTYLADGFHRFRAYELRKQKYLEAEVRAGELRDAILFSVGANAQHTALTRGPADKRKAVVILLADPEWGQWSARKIADAAGVNRRLVDRLKRQLAELTDSGGASGSNPQIKDGGVKVERGGQTYTMRYRDMTPKQQRAAVDAESDRHRPTWLREARQGLAQAERALQCLRAEESLGHVRAAQAALPS